MSTVSDENTLSGDELARRMRQRIEEELPLARKIVTGEATEEERERYWQLNNQPAYEAVDHWMARARRTLEHVEQSEDRYHDSPDLAYQYASLEAYRDSLYEGLFQEAYELCKSLDQATSLSEWRTSPPILNKVPFLRQALVGQRSLEEPALAYGIDKAIVDAVRICDSRYRATAGSRGELVDSRSPSEYSYEQWAATRFLERHGVSSSG